jgi:cytochrome c peroxidase
LPANTVDSGIGPVVEAYELDPDHAGMLGTYQPGGATITATNAFFQSMGTNGRTCATCHQPAFGMSVSRENIRKRFFESAGQDPLFAPVDGANCPNAVPPQFTAASTGSGLLGEGWDFVAAHSLILERGVFRIFLPVPANAEFTVAVLSDPNGCNTDPNYNQVTNPATGVVSQILSNYRRPLLSTNLIFVTTTASFGAPKPSGNLMWDGRELDLQTQAVDATLGHAQALTAPSAEQVAQIVSFETGIYSAQAFDRVAGDLTAQGASGGPINLSNDPAGLGAPAHSDIPPDPAIFSLFMAWTGTTGSTPADDRQASIARGQGIFDNKLFTIANVMGFNDVVHTNPFVGGTCGSCHNQIAAGTDSFGNAQHDLGVAGDSLQFNGPAPAKDLPIFKVTCNAGATPGYLGAVVLTNDLGKAGISGKCADIAKFSVTQLHALAARAPYFHDGSARTLRDVVEFYNKRFSIGYSEQEKKDLVNFLNSL